MKQVAAVRAHPSANERTPGPEREIVRDSQAVRGPLSYVGQSAFSLDEGTWAWVMLTVFAAEPKAATPDLLRALLAESTYQDDYVGSGPGAPAHGPYRLECLSAESFAPVSPEEARSVIQDWAVELADWANDAPVSEKLQTRLDRQVYSLFDGAEVLRLPEPGPKETHDFAWILGIHGYHEFLAIDRTSRRLTVVVATDD
jgi:hypothetical protein